MKSSFAGIREEALAGNGSESQQRKTPFIMLNIPLTITQNRRNSVWFRFLLAVAVAFASVLTGLPCSIAGAQPHGEGALFDGVSQHVRVDLEEGLTDTEAVTVAAWVKLNRVNGIQTFLNRGQRGELFTLYLYNDHVRMLVEYAPGRYAHASTAVPPAGTWTHFAGTWDGEVIRLFVNGEEVDSAAARGRMLVREAPLYIGATSPFMNVVDGRMADVRVFAAALDPEAIRQVFDGKVISSDEAELRLAGGDFEERVRTATVDDFEGEPALPFANGPLPKADGFRGIWYANQLSGDGLHKYSGGLGTYPQQHHPIAIYAEAVNKTFFTYGGTRKDQNRLLHMVSVYDHETGKVARPRILLDKMTDDAHDNPTMAIDADGFIWIFSNAHGTSRPSYIHRSVEPYSIDAFTRQVTTNFSYSQPWYIDKYGFVFLHTLYSRGRGLVVANSRNGVDWSEPRQLAHIAMGHYQISWPRGSTVGTAFNYHPGEGSPFGVGLNYRTNLYYVESDDGGYTWRNVAGEKLDMPLTEPDNPALAVEYESRRTIAYLKDIQYTAEGYPAILHLTSPGWESGPENDPRTFVIAHWTGSEWRTTPVTTTDNNYDFASLYIEDDGTWRIIGTTEPGPQPYNTGGEMAMWLSLNQGESWELTKHLTRNSEYNHTYPRRPLHAHPGFYAFWADGDGREMSPSRFYFTTKEGKVFRLPYEIEGDDEWIDPEPMP